MNVLLAATLFVVTTLDGREVYVNSGQVISMATPGDAKLFADGVRCVITLTDGKFVAVKESCAQVQARMAGAG